MRERVELGLKLLCVVLAVVLVQQVVQAVRRSSPLKAAKVPEVPSWAPPAPKSEGGGGTPGTAVAGPPPGTPPGIPPGLPPGASMRGGPGIAGLPMPMPGMPGGGGAGAGGPRVAQVVQSGLLAPVMRPPPMALMGIVGRDVILRSPEGQVGMIREGEKLGSVELVRIGTNRVLVRENGQEKELMIFQGYGGESLMPKAAKGETK